MSEYQYYEFAAIDRPLTRAEMADANAGRAALLRRLADAGLWSG